jgi:DNA-binding LytR/AlgR family response regulator
MKIRALIVDDEGPARSELAYLLAGFSDVETAEAPTGGSALKIIRDDPPDVVFLDIQMPGLDGFDVLREARLYPDPPLFVFVTAYDRYAIRAFEMNAVDYLLKPVTGDRLTVSVERVRELLAGREEAGDLQPELGDLLDSLPPGNPLPKLSVDANGRIQLIDYENIVYFELSGRKIVVNTHDKSFPCHGLATLDDVEARVGSLHFLRINRGVVVNLNRVREFSPWTGGKYALIMDDAGSTELTLSRGRVRDFKQRLGL